MAEGPRLTKHANMKMVSSGASAPAVKTVLRDNPILGPNMGGPTLVSIASSADGTIAGGGADATSDSSSASSATVGPKLGPMIITAKNGFSTQQVVDEANMDNFTTVTTKMKDMVSLLEKASDDDKTLVLFELQQVVEFDRNFVVENILPVVCINAHKWFESVQVPAAEALSTVLKAPISAPMAMRVCDVACAVISKASDQANRDLWGEVLVTALKFCSMTAKQLDRMVKNLRGNPNIERYSVTSKLTARILGAMALSCKDQETRKVVLERAVAMTSDKDEEVRGMIAESMAYIGASITISEVETDQWPALSQLSQDENACVHGACLKSLSIIAETHHSPTNTDNKFFRSLLPQLFFKECSQMRRFAALDIRSIHEDSYLIVEINSEIFGTMLTCCYEYLPDETARKEVFKAFMSMATCNSPVIRKNCAFNLPAATRCFEKSTTMMANLVEYLSHDLDEETRWTLASRLHETLPHIATRETIAVNFKAVLVLLHDENWMVRQNLVEHFQEIVAELSKYCTYNASSKMSSLFEQLQRLCDGDWRVQELLVQQLQLTAPLVPPISMTGNVLPLLDRVSRDGTYLVRKAAMGSMATFIRFVPDSLDRDRVMKKFCEDWACGPIYWMRIGFIDAAKVAMAQYSRCLFRDTFALHALRLAADPVSNVRLRLALLLDTIAPACYLMDEFTRALQSLCDDVVSDVREAARDARGKVQKSLKAGWDKFEDDMKREEEEREFFTRHLQNQREANKKRNNLKKAAGGWISSKITNMIKMEDIDSPVTPAGRVKPRSAGSTATEESPQHDETTHSAEYERTPDTESLYGGRDEFSSSAVKDDSDIFRQSRGFKGLRPFLNSKSGTPLKKRNSMMLKK